jgi:ABC-type transporter Mla subunit MlaD
MTRSTTLWAGTAAAALVIGALTACSDSPEENTADACASWDTYTAAVDDLITTLTSDAPTVGEVQDAREAVDEAYDDLESAAEDVAEDRTQAVEDAWDELGSAVDDVDDDATLEEARTALSEQASQVRAEADALNAELGCS